MHSRLELNVTSIAAHACLRVVKRASAECQRAYGNTHPRGRVVELVTDVPILVGGHPALRSRRIEKAGEDLGRRAVAEIGRGRVVYELPPRAEQRGRVVRVVWRCVVQ